MNTWIDEQLADGKSMADIAFIETTSHVQWLRGNEKRPGSWAVTTGPQDEILKVALSFGLINKILFSSGLGRGGRKEVGLIVGEEVVDDINYWLIDFEFEGYEDFIDTDGREI